MAVVLSDTATVAVGDTLRLAATARDANGHAVAAASFTWVSDDTLVLRVSWDLAQETGRLRRSRGIH